MYNLRNRKTRKLRKLCGYGCNCGEGGKQKHAGKNMHACLLNMMSNVTNQNGFLHNNVEFSFQ